ncbi:MAG TPA: hypothetical protein DEA05_13915, partial [Rhodobacteraceae bacterium]|nr:hypothetical protein [Paracoccaceae bacterium]
AALLRAGAREGAEPGRLRFPRPMVEEALAATPKTARLCGKTRARDIQIPRADGSFVLRTGTGAHGYVDPRDASYRNMDLTAVGEIAAVADRLDQMGFIAHPFVHGVPEVTADIHSYARITAHTTKHVWMQPYQKENVDYLLRIAAVAAGEIVGMVTMAHVLSPGLPVIATPLMFALDMRTGSALQSSVEAMQAASLSIQLVKQGFGLMAHTYGAGSDTPDTDGQSMAERAFLMQTVALAGADILGGVGQLECATVFSPVQAVLDDEMSAMMRRFTRPPEISDAALNFGEMLGVPVGGHFLDSDHTVSACRDQLIPRVFQRMGRDDYEASGRRTALDAAREAALSAIEAAPPSHLSEDQAREIAALTRAADRHIVEVYQGAVETI